MILYLPPLTSTKGPPNKFTEVEIEKISAAYKENAGVKHGGWLDKLSKEIGRPKANISRWARKKGLSDNKRIDTKATKLTDCSNCGKPFKSSIKYPRKYCSLKCSRIGTAYTRRGKQLWKDKPHPKGMLGKHHSVEYRKQISTRVSNIWKDKTSVLNSESNRQKHSDHMTRFMTNRFSRIGGASSVYSRTHKGWLELGNKKYFFRSQWEMNYARYLNWLMEKKEIKNWEYEVDTFWFEKIKRGVRSYTPDFKVFENNGKVVYHEVKGWMDQKSKTKLDRMKRYYPEIEILLIDEPQYKSLKKMGRLFGFE